MNDKSENENENIDLTKLLGRGSTPQNISQTCLELCRQYLGGVWLQTSLDEVKVERLKGGLTNQLYYCGINDDKRITDTKVPQEVAVLLYGQMYFSESNDEINKRLNGTVVTLLMSENGLGPKLYGVFDGGQILYFYKHKNFRHEEHNDLKLVEEVSRKLARIHAMDVPLKRTGNLLFDFFDDTYRVANESFDLKALIDESHSQTLRDYDVGHELEWVKKIILDLNPVQTFTHGDYRGANILITESDGIVICDFDLSSYGYRGFDFGTIFCEWGRHWGQWEDPHHFPNEQTFKVFINSYIEESVELKGKQFIEDNRNSFENILKEIKVFTLVGYIWIVMFLLAKNESIIPDVPFDKLQLMEPTEKVYKNAYHKCKQTLLKDKLIN